jgi:hypothetical protein
VSKRTYIESPTRISWHSMMTRCRNKNAKDYKKYGGRGIIICERWLDFNNFLIDMGQRPKGHTLDRINNEGNYEPMNCRWATPRTQQLNSRRKYIGPLMKDLNFFSCAARMQKHRMRRGR